jgi:hypothetical protein
MSPVFPAHSEKEAFSEPSHTAFTPAANKIKRLNFPFLPPRPVFHLGTSVFQADSVFRPPPSDAEGWLAESDQLNDSGLTSESGPSMRPLSRSRVVGR